MQIFKSVRNLLFPIQKYVTIDPRSLCSSVHNIVPNLWSHEINKQNVKASSLNSSVDIEDEPRNCALNTVNEDLSIVTPYYPKSFNLAAYVNSSETLQNLVHLNVNLSKIEKKPYIAKKLLKLDFEQNIKKHIFFLRDYVDENEIGNFLTKNPMILCQRLEDLEVRINYLESKNFLPDVIKRIVSMNPFWLMYRDYVDENEIGNFLTKNPMILCQRLEDLEVRINYLESKKFLPDVIKRIVSMNPFWLMYSTERIDRRLGYFQGKFTLSGQEVRQLTALQPRIITYNLHHINTNTFVIKEEMGFEDHEVKQLLLSKPSLWMINQRSLLERFNYIHNVIKIPHATILQNAEILLFRNFKVKQRHQFLENLGRAQYNPKKENYVPIIALIEDTDVEFCKKYAKCNIDDFNIFLKTL